MEKKKTRKPKSKLLRVTIGSLTLLFLAAATYLFFLVPDATSTINEIHAPVAREVSAKRPEKVVLEEKPPISFLLLGVDQHGNDPGRSDTIIVVTINPTDQSIKMVSIPRDTYTEITGYGISDKINHAYAFGGMMMSMESVETLLDIPIDYAIQVNMEGFQAIVDALGGVTIDSPIAFEDFSVGEQTLDGEQALRYVRMRKEDPNGDFGRQDRQKQVIQSIVDKTASPTAVFNYKKIFNALGDNVKTSASFVELLEIQKNYRSAINSIDQIYFEKGSGLTMNNIWYYKMDPEELETVQQTLKEHLDLK